MLPRIVPILLLVISSAPALAGGDGLLGLPDPLSLSYDGPPHVEPPPQGENARADQGIGDFLGEPPVPVEKIPNHRQMMRDIVTELSRYAQARDPRFLVVARGGLDLLHKGAREARWARLREEEVYPGPVGVLVRPYLNALDGLVLDGLYCGRRAFDRPTAPADRMALLHFAHMVRAGGGAVFNIDHCRANTSTQAVREADPAAAVPTFANEDPDGRLARVPSRRPPGENAAPVRHLDRVRTLLPVVAADRNADDWLLALRATNHDLLIVTAFPNGRMLTPEQVRDLKFKRLGARRLVLAAVPVAMAQDLMPYWRAGWRPGHPDWLGEADPRRAGVTWPLFWRAEWKEILGRHFKAAMDLGFDGVMLDGLDAYRRFEAAMPLPAPVAGGPE